MAVSENPFLISLVSYTTMSTAYLYTLGYINSSGYLVHGAVGTTGPIIAPIGSIYGVTKTTSTKSEAVPIAVGGVVKLKLSTDSTMNAGDFVSGSTKGYGCAAKDATVYTIGRILEVSDTGDNPIAKVLWGVPAPPTSGLVCYASSNNT